MKLVLKYKIIKTILLFVRDLTFSKATTALIKREGSWPVKHMILICGCPRRCTLYSDPVSVYLLGVGELSGEVLFSLLQLQLQRLLVLLKDPTGLHNLHAFYMIIIQGCIIVLRS